MFIARDITTQCQTTYSPTTEQTATEGLPVRRVGGKRALSCALIARDFTTRRADA